MKISEFLKGYPIISINLHTQFDGRKREVYDILLCLNIDSIQGSQMNLCRVTCNTLHNSSSLAFYNAQVPVRVL